MLWSVELVTNGNYCNCLEIEAESIEKDGFHCLVIDGVRWEVPEELDMSFAEVEITERGNDDNEGLLENQ